MPYARNSELPEAVRSALPAAAQTVFRNAFNSQSKRGLSEERSFASAWGAVRNAGYSKDDDGKWRKMSKAQPGMADAHVDKPMDDKKRKERKKNPCAPDDDEDNAEHMRKADAPDAISPDDTDIALTVDVAKVDADQRLVFGWLSVIEENGQTVVDLQDHVIEAGELEDAAYDFVLNSRVVGEMHERLAVGEGMVESMVFTTEKQAALGIDLGKVGWWVGFKVDADVFDKVKSGELSAFSIGGKAVLQDMLEAA